MLLTQNKTRDIFHSILQALHYYTLYYKENYNNRNSDKAYIVVVVCLLVVDSMKAVKSCLFSECYRDLVCL